MQAAERQKETGKERESQVDSTLSAWSAMQAPSHELSDCDLG